MLRHSHDTNLVLGFVESMRLLHRVASLIVVVCELMFCCPFVAVCGHRAQSTVARGLLFLMPGRIRTGNGLEVNTMQKVPWKLSKWGPCTAE